MEQYIRQTGLVNMQKVQDVNIAVIGAGGIGSWATLGLSKLGVGNVTVIDFDNVEQHNIPSQFHFLADIGESKVDALAQRIPLITGNNVTPINGEAQASMFVDSQIVISAVDNMKTRTEVFEQLRGQDKIFIDGRMSGNSINLYTVQLNSDTDVEKYARTLFSDDDADPVPCSERAVVYNTLIISGLITDIVARVISGEQYPFELIVDLKNFSLYGGLLEDTENTRVVAQNATQISTGGITFSL